MQPSDILDKAIIARSLRLRSNRSTDISLLDSDYCIKLYKSKDDVIYLTVCKRFLRTKRKTIGYYLSEQVDKELTVKYPKAKYPIYVYEDIQKMIERDKTYDRIISDSEKSIKELKENISIENILEPKKEDNSKLIQSLKRELNIIELKIQREELLKRIENAS